MFYKHVSRRVQIIQNFHTEDVRNIPKDSCSSFETGNYNIIIIYFFKN